MLRPAGCIYILTFLVVEEHVYSYAGVLLFKLINLLNRYWKLKPFPIILFFIRSQEVNSLRMMLNIFVM